MITKTKRCIHRHTEKSHPSCFRKGLINSDEWWEDLNIAYLDIEASDLDANWGIMLSWCIKYRNDPEIRYDVVSEKQIRNGEFDRGVVESLLTELQNADIIVTYYGTGFDVPFIRTRALKHGLEFPKFGTKYHWDLYYRVRGSMKLSSNSLKVATEFLGIAGKTSISPEIWFKAKFGDDKSLKYILDHNIADVEILETLHEKLFPFSKWIRKSI